MILSSSSVDLYLGLLHRLPDWSFQLWWWSSTWHTSPALSTDLGNLVDSHFWIPQMVNFSHENLKYIFILKARSIYENWTGNLNVAKILQPYVIETYAIEHVGTDSWGLMLVARIPFPSSRSQGALSLGRLPLSSPPLPYPALRQVESSQRTRLEHQAGPGFHTDKYLRQEQTKQKGWFSGAQRWTLFLFLYCLKYDLPPCIFNAHLDQNWSPLIKVFHLCRFWQRVTLSWSSPRVVIVCFREWVKTWELQVIIPLNSTLDQR